MNESNASKTYKGNVMALAYGIGGFVTVPQGAIIGSGAPPLNYIGGLGQLWFDKTATPYNEYTFTGSQWIRNASITAGTSVAMTAGTITISNPAVKTTSIIVLTANTPAGTQGILSAPKASIVNGTSFVINSSSNTDTSTVNYTIIN